MNRRGFLLGAIAPATAVALHASTSPPLEVEPRPVQFDFEHFNRGCDSDLCAWAVAQALDRLGWGPEDQPVPLLCHHPSAFVWAVEIRRALDDKLQILATRRIERDGWFVAWRGRRCGSFGA